MSGYFLGIPCGEKWAQFRVHIAAPKQGPYFGPLS